MPDTSKVGMELALVCMVKFPYRQVNSPYVFCLTISDFEQKRAGKMAHSQESRTCLIISIALIQGTGMKTHRST